MVGIPEGGWLADWLFHSEDPSITMGYHGDIRARMVGWVGDWDDVGWRRRVDSRLVVLA